MKQLKNCNIKWVATIILTIIMWLIILSSFAIIFNNLKL